MKNHPLIFVICITLMLASTAPTLAQSEWQVLNTLKLEHKPADMIVSADRSRIYVLTEKGKILIYGANGQFRDAIDVGRNVDQIKAGPSPDTLFLLNGKNATIQRVRVSLIENIDTVHAPYMGLADASVSVVVFSDFQ